MNNFQLNNTSIYLGGQCKWDIVVGNYNGQIYIQGFQLSPLSNNVPFNKKGSIDGLNEDHSYTLKKYCNTLKENLWSIVPDLTQTITKKELNSENIEKCSLDNSFIAGVRRSACYSIYHKQFEYLQPVWLEKIIDGDYLVFSFNIYSSNGGVLDSKTLKLTTIDTDGDKEKEKLFEFHNKFVVYFYNWLKALDIMGDKGNNKVLDINLQRNIAQVEGVSTLSGQKINPISCNYVCDNLLSYERPNIETDYIITSLLKSHNLLASQLFNLCFYFNLGDVTNPFISNQLTGNMFSMGVDVYEGNSASETSSILERRSIYTNYEFIKKSISDPYLQLSQMSPTSTGELKPDGEYNIVYEFNGVKGTEFNVLDYLQDYSISDIKDINKLSQHIIHWDFIDHNQDIFNLYNGYSGLNSFNGEIDQDPDQQEKINLYEFTNINGISVVWVDGIPTRSNGALNWINPTKIITVDSKQDIISKIAEYTESRNCILYQEGAWTIDKSSLDYDVPVDENNNLNDLCLSFIYIKDGEWNVSSETFLKSNWEKIISGPDNGQHQYEYVVLKYTNPSTPAGIKDHFIIMTNNLKWFGLKELKNDVDNQQASGSIDLFKDYLTSISNIVKKIDNKLYFYGFKTEIEIGKNDLEENCYYKSNKHSTYVYRRCGELSPCLKFDPDFSFNYQYCQSVEDGDIFRINNDEETEYEWGIEYRGIGSNKMFGAISELYYTATKGVDDEESLKDIIKEKLKETYRLGEDTTELLDYIYNLYNITFKYEYASEIDVKTVVYKIKLILK